MQRYIKVKHVVLLLGLLMPAVWCGANILGSLDGYSNINIKEGNVHSTPKGSTIQAYIDGHTLTVVFTENIGQVTIEVTTGPMAICITLPTQATTLSPSPFPTGMNTTVSLR